MEVRPYWSPLLSWIILKSWRKTKQSQSQSPSQSAVALLFSWNGASKSPGPTHTTPPSTSPPSTLSPATQRSKGRLSTQMIPTCVSAAPGSLDPSYVCPTLSCSVIPHEVHQALQNCFPSHWKDSPSPGHLQWKPQVSPLFSAFQYHTYQILPFDLRYVSEMQPCYQHLVQTFICSKECPISELLPSLLPLLTPLQIWSSVWAQGFLLSNRSTAKAWARWLLPHFDVILGYIRIPGQPGPQSDTLSQTN